MALRLTQPLTEMSTKNLQRGKGRPVRKADNLTAIFEPIIWKMWEPRRLTSLWAFTASYSDNFAFFYTLKFFLYEVHFIIHCRNYGSTAWLCLVTSFSVFLSRPFLYLALWFLWYVLYSVLCYLLCGTDATVRYLNATNVFTSLSKMRYSCFLLSPWREITRHDGVIPRTFSVYVIIPFTLLNPQRKRRGDVYFCMVYFNDAVSNAALYSVQLLDDSNIRNLERT
jgi:hypothetical protein